MEPLKTIRVASPNFALSNHPKDSSYQSRETAPFPQNAREKNTSIINLPF
jgi:hypothetical protein